MKLLTLREKRERNCRYSAKWRALNPEKRKAVVARSNFKRRAKAKRWRKQNAERVRLYNIAYREKKNASRRANRVADREYERRQRLLHPEKHRAKKALRRAALFNATPPWVDRKKLQAVYRLAVKQGKHVDHIIPLKHPRVCGLHVPWNLQLLTLSENTRKGNRIILDAA